MPDDFAVIRVAQLPDILARIELFSKCGFHFPAIQRVDTDFPVFPFVGQGLRQVLDACEGGAGCSPVGRAAASACQYAENMIETGLSCFNSGYRDRVRYIGRINC